MCSFRLVLLDNSRKLEVAFEGRAWRVSSDQSQRDSLDHYRLWTVLKLLRRQTYSKDNISRFECIVLTHNRHSHAQELHPGRFEYEVVAYAGGRKTTNTSLYYDRHSDENTLDLNTAV
jgi:hypothetical protein